LLDLGRGYAARYGFVDNPKSRVIHKSIPAWTTLRVAHIPTAPAATKDFYVFKDLKPKLIKK
jgi:hypothetical protein